MGKRVSVHLLTDSPQRFDKPPQELSGMVEDCGLDFLKVRLGSGDLAWIPAHNILYITYKDDPTVGLDL